MNRLILALFCGFALVVSPFTVPATAQEGVTVRAVAVSVAGRVDEEAFEFSPLQGQTGTKVSALIDLSGGGATIVGLDDDASEVASFTDAAGNDLLKDEKEDEGMGMSFRMMPSLIGSFPHVSKDGKQIVLDFQAPTPPAAGSGSVHVKGTILLQVADGTLSRKVENLAFKPGAVVDKQGQITIASVGDADWGDAAMSVTMKMPRATLDQIATITFYDANGDDITEGRSSTMTMMNQSEVVWNLTKKVDAATIELTLHDGMRQMQVPVDLSVTLGL